jgi:hypothetical protein
MEVGPLVAAVPQGRGHIRSRSPLKDRREKPTLDKVGARTKTDSRFNIPAPAMVKLQSDVFEERSCRLKVAVAQADVETVDADSLKRTPRKAL